MKKYIFISLLILTSFYSYAQKNSVPKGTVKIIVKTDKSAKDNFLYVKQMIAERGMEVDKQDGEIFQIVTGKNNNKFGISSYYIIFCQDNTIKINGNFRYAKDPFEPITMRGMKGSTDSDCFLAMNDFALTLGNEPSYESGKK